MREGDPGDKFYILLHGSAVAVTRDEEAGANEAEGAEGGTNARGGGGGKKKSSVAPHRVVRSYGPGAHFGELALLTGRPRSATVVAEERCVALVLEKDALLGLGPPCPALEDHIVRGMRHYDHIEPFTSMAMAVSARAEVYIRVRRGRQPVQRSSKVSYFRKYGSTRGGGG